MLDPTNFDPRPLRVRIKDMLGKHPEGLMTKELAAHLGDPQYTVSGVLSKLVSYGAGVQKVRIAVPDRDGAIRARYKYRLMP